MGSLLILEPMGGAFSGGIDGIVSMGCALLGILISLVMLIVACVAVVRARREGRGPWRRVLGYPAFVFLVLGVAVAILLVDEGALLGHSMTFTVLILLGGYAGTLMSLAVLLALRYPISRSSVARQDASRGASGQPGTDEPGHDLFREDLNGNDPSTEL